MTKERERPDNCRSSIRSSGITAKCFAAFTPLPHHCRSSFPIPSLSHPFRVAFSSVRIAFFSNRFFQFASPFSSVVKGTTKTFPGNLHECKRVWKSRRIKKERGAIISPARSSSDRRAWRVVAYVLCVSFSVIVGETGGEPLPLRIHTYIHRR